MSVAGNKDFIKSLGVLALPTMHIYIGAQGLAESFPCGPSKFPSLKRKLVALIKQSIDPDTLELKEIELTLSEDKGTDVKADLTVEGENFGKEQRDTLRSIPYFADFTEDEFADVMSKAKLLSFDEGSVIMREGKKGRSFYVIESGEVEIFCNTAYEDPLATPSSYLGTAINKLGKDDFFGERSLITGELRAASIRTNEKTRCFVFDRDDMPSSTVLSGKAKATASRIEEVNDKYGVDFQAIDMLEVSKQLEASKLGSQIRGSANSPKPIKGVDTDVDETMEEIAEELLPASNVDSVDTEYNVLNLLQKFRLMRHAARCFDYIIEARPQWGNPGALRRRSMLVSKLSQTRQQEFLEVFRLIDESGDMEISLIELKRALESVGEEKSDADLQEMITRGHGNVDGKQIITQEDFLGIMAEAEFYNLFRDMFSTLDQHDTGFVKAKELDRILCGMRDLISDDRKSIIDIEDQDMLIDYEQFSKMLLGSPAM